MSDATQETSPLSLEVVELSRYFVQGLMDAGQELGTVLSTPTVDLFLIVGSHGYVVTRLLNFDYADWLTVCDKLPPRTTIDPGEWELHSLGFESIYIPPPQNI